MVNAAREDAYTRRRVQELTPILLNPKYGYEEHWIRDVVTAAKELGELDHPAAIEPLTRAMRRYKDEHLGLWDAAARALAQINDPRATSLLIKEFKKTGRLGNERAMMVRALGETKRAAVIPYLARVAGNGREHWSIRDAALQGLGNFPHPKAVKALVKNLSWEPRPHDSDNLERRGAKTHIRTISAQSLMRIGKAIGKKPVSDNYSQALQLISPHLREGENHEVVRAAYGAALKGKINQDNARLYVKQLRAQQGNLK